jgi:lantibiotic modifying enzyme
MLGNSLHTGTHSLALAEMALEMVMDLEMAKVVAKAMGVEVAEEVLESHHNQQGMDNCMPEAGHQMQGLWGMVYRSSKIRYTDSKMSIPLLYQQTALAAQPNCKSKLHPQLHKGMAMDLEAMAVVEKATAMEKVMEMVKAMEKAMEKAMVEAVEKAMAVVEG